MNNNNNNLMDHHRGGMVSFNMGGSIDDFTKMIGNGFYHPLAPPGQSNQQLGGGGASYLNMFPQ